MEMIVIGWLVLDITNSAWLVALVGFFRSAPFLIAGFIGGPLTDRYGRKAVIQSTQAISMLVYAMIAILVFGGLVELWHLSILSFILGVGWALEFPARRSLIPDIVGKDRTVDALLLESTVQGISRIVGPTLAGGLIARYGPEGCFAFMTGLSLFALIGVLALNQQPILASVNGGSESTWQTIFDGLHYVARHQGILAIVLVTVVMNLLIFPYVSLMPVFARDILGQGPQGLGALGTATGIGAFIGLILINYFRRWINIGRIFIIGTIGQCIGLALFAMSTIFLLSWFLLICAGIGQACFAILQSSIVLVSSSDEMRSRAMATVVLAIGADPIGKIQIGLLAENLGAPYALGMQAVVAAALVGAVALLLPESYRGPSPSPTIQPEVVEI